MGVDFIRQGTASFKKSWDRHRVDLCERTLFTQDPERAARTALAKIDPTVSAESSILVRAEGAALVGYRELTRSAVFIDPPAELVRAVRESGGYAEGKVVTVHEGNVAEIAIC